MLIPLTEEAIDRTGQREWLETDEALPTLGVDETPAEAFEDCIGGLFGEDAPQDLLGDVPAVVETPSSSSEQQPPPEQPAQPAYSAITKGPDYGASGRAKKGPNCPNQ